MSGLGGLEYIMIGKLENRNVKMCNMLQWAVVLITWNQPHW